MVAHDIEKISKYAKLWDSMASSTIIKIGQPIPLCSTAYPDEEWIVREIIDNQERLKGNHFYGVILQNKDDYIVAYKGTDFTTYDGIFHDFILSDAPLAIGSNTSQLESAQELFELALPMANNDLTKINVLGHSLGGGLAQYIGVLYHPVQTYTFDALGAKRTLNLKLREKLHRIKHNKDLNELENFNYDPDKNYNNIYNYMSVMDLVGNLAPHCGNQCYYINKPLDYLNDKDVFPVIKHEFKLVKKIVDRLSDLRESMIPDKLNSLFRIPANYLNKIVEDHPSLHNILIENKNINGVEASYAQVKLNYEDADYSHRSLYSKAMPLTFEKTILSYYKKYLISQWAKDAHSVSVFYEDLKITDISEKNDYFS